MPIVLKNLINNFESVLLICDYSESFQISSKALGFQKMFKSRKTARIKD